MNPVAKLAAFALILLLAFGVGSAIGAAVGPIDVTPAEHDEPADHGSDAPEPTHGSSSTTHPEDHGSTSSTEVLR